MDFSRLQPVKKVNPVGQKFNIEWKPGKDAFRLSDAMFAKMDLEYNSLRQFDDTVEEGEEVKLVGVFLAVCPGNSGAFHKKQKGKAKGKTFKNIALSESVASLGITSDAIDIEHKGKNGDMEMYQIISVAQVEDSGNLPSREDELASNSAEPASPENVSVTEDKF